jgi:hypothetical protein
MTATATYPGVGPVIIGRDWSYFNKISVNTSTFGGNNVASQPDIIIPFAPQEVRFLNLQINSGSTFPSSPTSVVEYSFTGNQLHGECGSNANNVYLQFRNRVISCIWFRVQSGSSGPVLISIEAWSIR